MWIQDSTSASGGNWAPGSAALAASTRLLVPRISNSLPVTSRRTTTCGWITRWIARSWRDSSAVTESTRNGMSSVTTSTTVWLQVQPFSSTEGVATRTFAAPCGRSSPSR